MKYKLISQDISNRENKLAGVPQAELTETYYQQTLC